MWLSKQNQKEILAEQSADLGSVTVGGNPAGVYLSGERRHVPVFTPGGYTWVPMQGDTVLVMKSGAEKRPCVVGQSQQVQPDLRPGEVKISVNPKASLCFRQDGVIELKGTLVANGVVLSEPQPSKEGGTG